LPSGSHACRGAVTANDLLEIDSLRITSGRLYSGPFTPETTLEATPATQALWTFDNPSDLGADTSGLGRTLNFESKPGIVEGR